jgi:hypothetical protein
MKIIERIYDATTGETTDTERELTAEEITQYESRKSEVDAENEAKAAAQIKRAAALSKLEALGLDETDLTALGL